MFIMLYYVRIWTEGVWSGKRTGTNSTLAIRPFRTRQACQEYIYMHLPYYTTQHHNEPTWVNYEIIEKRQYIPVKAK